MSEIKKVSKDVYNGQLPPAEYGGFLAYLITHNLGKVSIALVIGAAIAWVLTP